MKKLLLLALVALFAPVFTQAAIRSDYVKRFETCEAILREFMADPAYAIPAPVLQRARAIVITTQFKAGFVLGLKGGYGIVMVKRPDNQWSLPVLLSAGEGSFGLQVGVKNDETILVITDDQTPRMLFNNRFNIGVDAKAVAGPKWAEMESVNREILNTPVLVYTKSKGLFAGATLKAGYLTRDDTSNRKFYQSPYTAPELLYGNFVQAPPEVQPLISYVQSIAP